MEGVIGSREGLFSDEREDPVWADRKVQRRGELNMRQKGTAVRPRPGVGRHTQGQTLWAPGRQVVDRAVQACGSLPLIITFYFCKIRSKERVKNGRSDGIGDERRYETVIYRTVMANL